MDYSFPQQTKTDVTILKRSGWDGGRGEKYDSMSFGGRVERDSFEVQSGVERDFGEAGEEGWIGRGEGIRGSILRRK